MSLWSVIQGIGAQINPFDNGKTFATYNPPAPQQPQTSVPAQFNRAPQAPQLNRAPQPIQTPQLNNNIPTQQAPLSMGTLQVNNQVSVPQAPTNTLAPASAPALPDLAPAAGDVPGLTKALSQFGIYNQDDQTRILNRASMAGLIPKNVAASNINQILAPTPYKMPSKLDDLGNAIADTATAGLANVARDAGTTLAANSLYSNKNFNPSQVTSDIAPSYAANGLNVMDPNLTHAIETIGGQSLSGVANLAGLGLGGVGGDAVDAVDGVNAANTAKNALTMADRAKGALKIGGAFGVPGGVSQSLSQGNLSPGNIIKNVATNTLQDTALPFASSLAKAGGEGLLNAAKEAGPLNDGGYVNPGGTNKIVQGTEDRFNSENPTPPQRVTVPTTPKTTTPASDIPRYTQPSPGKVSVPGHNTSFYSTGDSNLDGIVHDSVIAHKGTAPTAGSRANALDRVGIDATQRAQIRDIATHNVDKNTGKINNVGVARIKGIVSNDSATALQNDHITTPQPQTVQTPQDTTLQQPVDSPSTQNSPQQSPATQPVQTSPPTEGENPVQESQPQNQSSSLSNNVPPTESNVNPDIKNARFQDAVVNASKNPAMKSALEEAAQNKNTAPMAEMNGEAIDRVQRMTTSELITNYGKDFTDKSSIDTPQQLYEHLQALKQLEALPEDPAAQKAAANVLRSINDYAYRSGVGTKAMQLAYNDLPASMKTSYLDKLVQKAGGSMTEEELNNITTETIKQTELGKAAAKADAVVNEISTQRSAPDFATNMENALKTQEETHTALENQNAIILSMLKEHIPPSSIADRIIANARTSMLSSPAGRAFAMQSTGSNLVGYVADKTASAIAGKVRNAITGENDVKASLPNVKLIPGAAINGIKNLYKATFGKAPVKSVEGALKNPYDGEYSHDNTQYGKFGNSKLVAPLRKVGHFMVGSHLAVTSGVKDMELEQYARQEAARLGDIPKENMPAWIKYVKNNAPEKINQEVDQAHLRVNNLHKNGFSNALQGINSAITKMGASGKGGPIVETALKTFKTVIMPFPTYAGGLIDNIATDRNIIYNAFRMAAARSPQEFVDQLGHATTNVVAGGGIGFMLAKNGVLTNHDQNGKKYDGIYIHLGNKYYSGALMGSLVGPVTMGAELYDSLHNGNKNLGSWGADFAKNTFDRIMAASGAGSTFGAFNPFSIASGGTGYSNALAKMSGQAIQQHIPAVGGDINAVLNQTSMDPTHEAANTKATSFNSTTGRFDKNYVGTAINSIKNAIPGVSQGLPRAPGVIAPTEFDKAERAGTANPVQAAESNALPSMTKNPDLVTKLPGGQYTYMLNGVQKVAKTQYAAQTAVDKAAYDKSGATTPTVMHGNVFTKNPQTDKITVQTKSVYDYKQLTNAYSINTSTLSDMKSTNNYSGWVTTAQNQLKNIQDQLNSSTATDVQKAKLKSDAQTLINEMAKYQAGAAFGTSSSSTVKKIKTTMGTLKASPFAPKAKAYSTATLTGNNSIPVIKAINPHIVHAIHNVNN